MLVVEGLGIYMYNCLFVKKYIWYIFLEKLGNMIYLFKWILNFYFSLYKFICEIFFIIFNLN